MLITPIWKHFSAFIYDLFPLVGIFILTSFIVLLFRKGENVEPFSAWFIVLIYSEIAFYYIYSWKKGGQTLGMRAWKMKIIPNQSNQTNISWTQAFMRFFIGVISTLFLGTGLFWKLFSKRKLSWMDIISDSETKIFD
ncbi:MAG: RDD family protein [Alcanivoracaceae bacterium]|nr:RDD family protein [Alcanivoracaceae bacterium]